MEECEPLPDFVDKMSTFPNGSMFNTNVVSWKEIPQSLHFSGCLPPSPASVELMKQLSSIIHGKEGEYGAGGGLLYVFYIGRLKDHESPSLLALLEALHVVPSLNPLEIPWISTLDPCHQLLFPRLGEEECDGRNLLREIYECSDNC
jgi:hypothetical protein